MARPTHDWARATAHRIGMGGEVAYTRLAVGQTLHIPCRRGDHLVDVTISSGQHPDAIVKKMLNLGWSIGSHPICPDCNKRGRRKKPKEDAVTAKRYASPNENGTMKENISARAMKATASTATMGATFMGGEISDAAKRAHRLAMMMLEECYDVDAKRYKQGYTDKRIAEECGCSEAHVSEQREQWFGPLGEPAELTALRADMAKALDAIEAAGLNMKKAMEDIGKINTRFERLCTKQGWPIA